MDIFTKLNDSPKTSSAFAKEFDYDQRGVRILFDALGSTGLLEKKDSAYMPSQFSKSFLVSNKVPYIGHRWLSLSHPALWEAYSNLSKSVVSGRPFRALLENSDFWRDQAKVGSVSEAALKEASALCNLLKSRSKIPKNARVLDLGCGAGVDLCALAQYFDGLTGTGVDWPPVVEIARDVARRMHVDDRIDFVPDDISKVELKEKFDVAILSQVLQVFTLDHNLSILRRANGFLKNGGILIINELPIQDDRQGPLQVLLISLGLLTMTEGDAYTFPQLSDLTQRAGFSKLENLGDGYMTCRKT